MNLEFAVRIAGSALRAGYGDEAAAILDELYWWTGIQPPTFKPDERSPPRIVGRAFLVDSLSRALKLDGMCPDEVLPPIERFLVPDAFGWLERCEATAEAVRRHRDVSREGRALLSRVARWERRALVKTISIDRRGAVRFLFGLQGDGLASLDRLARLAAEEFLESLLREPHAVSPAPHVDAVLLSVVGNGEVEHRMFDASELPWQVERISTLLREAERSSIWSR